MTDCALFLQKAQEMLGWQNSLVSKMKYYLFLIMIQDSLTVLFC